MIRPPDTKVQSETLEEIAHGIVAMFYEGARYPSRFAAYSHVLSCLHNERERCAKLAETVHDDKVFDVDLILRNEIAKAIREGR